MALHEPRHDAEAEACPLILAGEPAVRLIKGSSGLAYLVLLTIAYYVIKSQRRKAQ